MAQTRDEKAAEKDAKLEAQHVEEQKAADDEAAKVAATARSASETEASAFDDLHTKIVAEVTQRLRDQANDQDVDDSFGGQHVTSDHFSVATTESFGRQTVEIKPSGWVGEGFVVAGSRLKELADVLGQVKNLPDAE